MDKYWRFYIRRAFNGLGDGGFDAEEAYEKVRRRIGWRRIRRFTARAAAVLALAAVTGYFTYRWAADGGTGDEGVAGGEGPGRIELILATGRHVTLDGNDPGTRVRESGMRFVQDSVNEMRYEHVDRGDEGRREEMEFNQLNIPQGAEYSLSLPDGSRIKLNSESSLRFPVRFAEDKREVFLDGEAYLSVARDSAKPFVVHAGELTVTVLGTSFNVSAYSDDALCEVTLVDGHVLVEKEGAGEHLYPSDQYVLDRSTGESFVREVDTGFYTSWVDGNFHFKNYRLEDIVRKLERWYDFHLFYKQEEIKDLRFRGTINRHTPLEEVLHYIEGTTNIRFNINGKTVVVEKI